MDCKPVKTTAERSVRNVAARARFSIEPVSVAGVQGMADGPGQLQTRNDHFRKGGRGTRVCGNPYPGYFSLSLVHSAWRTPPSTCGVGLQLSRSGSVIIG